MKHGCTIIALLFSAYATADTNDGEYVFHAAGCLACHTVEDGEPLAGGRQFETPFGVFYAPNITPDNQHGIGHWTREQFIAALKQGVAPDGRAYFPVFPYPSYQLMRDEDASNLYDYLMSRPAVAEPNRPHELPWWLSDWMIKPWQWWLQDEPPAPPSDARLARGRYLVDALGHCGECHSPRNWAGVKDQTRYLGGTKEGPEGENIPNITPHRDDGIGKWRADDLAYYLEIGELPDGDYAGSLMAEVIDNSTSRLTPQDREAMVAYLRSIDALPDL